MSRNSKIFIFDLYFNCPPIKGVCENAVKICFEFKDEDFYGSGGTFRSLETNENHTLLLLHGRPKFKAKLISLGSAGFSDPYSDK